MKKSMKEKYDYIINNEIKRYKISFYIIGVSVFFAINLYASSNQLQIGGWFFFRFFAGIGGGTIMAYVSSLILEYYYPTFLYKKLNKIRYTPRINTKTGNVMRLLREDEEDIHLAEEEQAEENIFSVDYDVWHDDETNEVIIEKYMGNQLAVRCNDCGFYTMRVFQEEVVEVDEEEKPIELIRHYKCGYCKSLRATQFKVSKRKNVDDFLASEELISGNEGANIAVIRLILTSQLGAEKSFEFKTVAQLKQFLNEFNFDQLG